MIVCIVYKKNNSVFYTKKRKAEKNEKQKK